MRIRGRRTRFSRALAKFIHSLLDMADHQTSPNVAARKSRPKKKKLPSEEPLEDVEVSMEEANPPPRARSYVFTLPCPSSKPFAPNSNSV